MITAFVLVFSLLIPGAGLGFIPIGVADLNDGLEKHLEPPIISIWSPLNQTHGTDVFLNFSISSPRILA